MRFKSRALVAPALISTTLLLAACGKSGSSVSLTNATADQVAAAQTAAAKEIQPGEWDVTAEIVKQETTGGPPALANMPKLPPTTTKICITPEQAAKPEAMFGGKGMEQFKKACTYDKFEMSGGKMAAEMHCDLGTGMKVHTSVSGTFSGTEMTTTSTGEVNMPGGMTTKSETKMTAHRIGDSCQPGDMKPGIPKAG